MVQGDRESSWVCPDIDNWRSESALLASRGNAVEHWPIVRVGKLEEPIRCSVVSSPTCCCWWCCRWLPKESAQAEASSRLCTNAELVSFIGEADCRCCCCYYCCWCCCCCCVYLQDWAGADQQCSKQSIITHVPRPTLRSTQEINAQTYLKPIRVLINWKK